MLRVLFVSFYVSHAYVTVESTIEVN